MSPTTPPRRTVLMIQLLFRSNGLIPSGGSPSRSGWKQHSDERRSARSAPPSPPDRAGGRTGRGNRPPAGGCTTGRAPRGRDSTRQKGHQHPAPPQIARSSGPISQRSSCGISPRHVAFLLWRESRPPRSGRSIIWPLHMITLLYTSALRTAAVPPGGPRWPAQGGRGEAQVLQQRGWNRVDLEVGEDECPHRL